MIEHKEKTMDWNAFNPLTALAGGALIGLASLLLLLMLGRIAGISGILGGLLQRPDADTAWRRFRSAGPTHHVSLTQRLHPYQ